MTAFLRGICVGAVCGLFCFGGLLWALWYRPQALTGPLVASWIFAWVSYALVFSLVEM